MILSQHRYIVSQPPFTPYTPGASFSQTSRIGSPHRAPPNKLKSHYPPRDNGRRLISLEIQPQRVCRIPGIVSSPTDINTPIQHSSRLVNHTAAAPLPEFPPPPPPSRIITRVSATSTALPLSTIIEFSPISLSFSDEESVRGSGRPRSSSGRGTVGRRCKGESAVVGVRRIYGACAAR